MRETFQIFLDRLKFLCYNTDIEIMKTSIIQKERQVTKMNYRTQTQKIKSRIES